MIGLDHEPSRAILDSLNEALGEGAYSIAYLDGQHGVEGIIRTREQPQREFRTRFAPNAGDEQVEAIWQELVARTVATLKHEREQEAAAGRAYRPEPTPANEVQPGKALPGTITEQTDVTESESDLTDDELIEKVASRHDAEGTTYADPGAVTQAERSSDDESAMHTQADADKLAAIMEGVTVDANGQARIDKPPHHSRDPNDDERE